MHFSPKTVRILRRALLTLATLVTVLAAVITFENWRGARAWRLYREAAAARGDPVDVFPAPAPLAAERNFFATPALDRWILQSGEETRKRTEAHLAGLKVEWRPGFAMAGWRDGTALALDVVLKNLSGAQTAAPPPEQPERVALRNRLAAAEPVLAELRAAAVRCPEAELQQAPWKPGENLAARPIPSFNLCRTYTGALVLDARLALDDGQIDHAFAATLAGLQLARGLFAQRDVTLVATMIGCVVLERAVQPLWEGVQRHAWSDAQLAAFERVLASCAPLEAFERSMRGERTFLALVELRGDPSVGDLSARLNWDAWFPGLVAQNRLSCCRALEPQLAALAARDSAGFLEAIARRDRETEAFLASMSPYRWLARMAMPAHEKITERSVAVEVFVRLAHTACALERHRLAHGQFPATLAELSPGLPPAVLLDPVNGQPLRYARKANGEFSLYSVGMDGRDDRGAAAKASRSNGEAFTGDWIWPQLASTAAAKP